MNVKDMLQSSTHQLLMGLKNNDYTPYDLLGHSKSLIHTYDWRVRAMTDITPDDEPVLQSGFLYGLPVAIKDIYETKDFPTNGGSLQFLHFQSDRDATIVDRIRKAGGLIIGKTNTPEAAMDYQTFNKTHGITHNPYDLYRTPGGSSGGSAAALAMRYIPLALGGDLGGSLRQPASFCGVYSLRPTIGSLPSDGHLPDVGEGSGSNNHVATIGPMAIDLYGTKLLWYALNGEKKAPDLIQPREELNLLVSPSLDLVPIDIRIKKLMLDTFSDLDAPVDVDIMSDYNLDKAQQVYMGLFHVLVGQSDVSTLDQFLPLRDEVQQEQVEMMEAYDAWIMPVTSVLPYTHNLEQRNFIRDEKGEYTPLEREKHEGDDTLNYWVANGMYCRPISASGLPTITIPLGMIEGLPQGIQIIGRPNEEEELFAIAVTLDNLLGERIPLPHSIPNKHISW